MHRRPARAAAALVLLALAATAGDTAQVAIDNFAFGGGTATVGLGTQITWTNRDDIPHTVTRLADAGFRSGALDTGDSFTYAFTRRGTFRYFCSLHPKMRGVVVVK